MQESYFEFFSSKLLKKDGNFGNLVTDSSTPAKTDDIAVTKVTTSKEIELKKVAVIKEVTRGAQGSGYQVTKVTSAFDVFIKKIKTLLPNVKEKEINYLYNLYEERAEIIEDDVGYRRGLAEETAFEEVRRLCKTKVEGIKIRKQPNHTGKMIDKECTPDGVEISSDIVLYYEENTREAPPYWIPKKIVKGIDLNNPKIKEFLNNETSI